MSGQSGKHIENENNGPSLVNYSNGDPLRSPLHRLQTEIAKDSKYSIERSPSGAALRIKELHQSPDNESIYSFDSVSTSGRLLDRLDLSPDDYNDDTWLRRRESIFLIQGAGRLLDRLGLEESASELGTPPSVQHSNSLSSARYTRLIPIRANSTLGMERLRSSSKISFRVDSQSCKFPLKSAPVGAVCRPMNNSFDSIHGDIASASPTSTLSLVSLDSETCGNNPKHSSSHDALECSTPDQTSLYVSKVEPQALPRPGLTETYQKQRSASGHSVSSTNSVSSFDCAQIIFNPTLMFDPKVEANLRKAIVLRIEDSHREASYQLQVLASAPINYPKAMYLYAKALQNGQGVKLNYLQSIRWLCRCILVCYMLEFQPPSDMSALNIYANKLAEIKPERLISIIIHYISGDENDPFQLFDYFKSLNPTILSKLTSLNSKDNNLVGSTFYTLGNALLLGQGVSKDEEKARTFYAKAASVAYGDAMVTLGELWADKSKSFKKDLHLAAAWLRLGELFGKQDMGNSWIYKDKYMERRTDHDKKNTKDRKLF